MKKYLKVRTKLETVFIVIVFSLSGYSTESAAAFWDLYDNFSSGVIDPAKWDIDDNSASITAVGGAVRFQTYPNMFEDSAWLRVADHPENVKGIKFNGYLGNNCGGDVRLRSGAVLGFRGATVEVFGQVMIRANSTSERINTNISEGDVSGDYIYLRDLFAAAHPGYGDIDVTGKWITVTMLYNKPWKMQAWTNQSWSAQGGASVKTNYRNPMGPVPSGREFAGIGTRTRDDGSGGSGECTMWVDNVYLHRS